MDQSTWVDGEPDSALQTVIVPPTKEIDAGVEVRRALPSARRRMVGPFIFFDHIGPALLGGGQGLDVRPHPHIGLATVTYLFEGALLHRDSLGTVQTIRPGEVNWMTAGRGIVHSERTPPEDRPGGSRLFGIQVWVALPKAHEERAPDFVHHGAGELPALEGEGARLRLVVGALAGARSPVRTLSEMFYGELRLEPSARFALAPEHEERAVYVVEGGVEVEGEAGRRYPPGQLLVLKPGVQVVLRADGGATPTRLMLLGGAAMDGPRHVWWNLVSSSRERIEEAKQAWRERRFPAVPEETEFIPAPDDQPAPPVRYP